MTVSVTADDVNWFQSLIGVDAPAVIGNLTAVNPDGFKAVADGGRMRAVRGPPDRRHRLRASGQTQGKAASKGK